MLKIIIVFIIFSIASNSYSQEKEGYYMYNWKLKNNEQITNGVPELVAEDPEWIDVQVGEKFIIGLKKDGTIWSAGNNFNGQLGLGHKKSVYELTQIGTDSNWVVITTSSGHTLAIKKDGTLWSWGWNNSGVLGLGHGFDENEPKQIGKNKNWDKIYAFHAISFAITKDSLLYGWGNNNENINDDADVESPKLLDSTKKIISVSNFDVYYNFFFDKNNQLYELYRLGGKDENVNLEAITKDNDMYIPNLSNIYGNHSSFFGTDIDNNLWIYGWNLSGKLGNGNTDDIKKAKKSTFDKKVKDVVNELNYSFILDVDNNIYSCGSNIGQYIGSYRDRYYSFKLINNDGDWIKVAGGSSETYALKKTKISEQTNVKSIKSTLYIYPNPSTGKFNFTLNAELGDELKVIDINGDVVFKTNIFKSFNNELFELDLSELNSGVYFIELNTKNKINSDKIIIQR